MFVSSAASPVLFFTSFTGTLALLVTRKSQPSFQIASYQGGGFDVV